MEIKRSKLVHELERGNQIERAARYSPGLRKGKGGVKKGQKRGKYKKNPKREKTGGRQKGTPNTLSREAKEEIIAGLTEFGQDGKGKDGLKGFVKRVAAENIPAAASLLRAVLPMETKLNLIAEVNVPYQTLDEAIKEAIEAGIPERQILDLKDYYLLPPPAEATIEVENNG